MAVKNKNKNKNKNTNKNTIHININTEKKKRKKYYSNKKANEQTILNKSKPNISPTIINNYITHPQTSQAPQQILANPINSMLNNNELRRSNNFTDQTQYTNLDNTNPLRNPIINAERIINPIITAENVRTIRRDITKSTNESEREDENIINLENPTQYTNLTDKIFKSDSNNDRVEGVDQAIYSEPSVNKSDLKDEKQPSLKVQPKNENEIAMDKLIDEKNKKKIQEIKKFIEDSGYKNIKEYDPETDNDLNYLKHIETQVRNWKEAIDFLHNNKRKIEKGREYDFDYIINKYKNDKRAIKKKNTDNWKV